MSSTSTTRRVVAGAALAALPLSLATSGIAFAGGGDGDQHTGPGQPQSASQDGGLLGLLAQVNPALNVGGILSGGAVTQTALADSSANSGIIQGPGSGGKEAFQAADLVEGLLQINPAANVGGILNSGPVSQTAVAGSDANSGIQQYGGGSGHGGGNNNGGHDGGGHDGGHNGGGHDGGWDECEDNDGGHGGGHNGSGGHGGGNGHGGGHNGGGNGGGNGHGGGHNGGGNGGGYNGGSAPVAYQGGSLIDLPVQVNPALNVGGILNSGPVYQQAVAASDQNSGIQQGGRGHGGAPVAYQAGGLVNLPVQVNPALNVGGIGNSGPVVQQAGAVSDQNSGIQQGGRGHGGSGPVAYQAGSLVNLPVQVNPAANVGGILNSGPVYQQAVAASDQNSGIQQGGRGQERPQTVTQRGLINLNVQVNPSLNVGGILSGGGVSQSAASI